LTLLFCLTGGEEGRGIDSGDKSSFCLPLEAEEIKPNEFKEGTELGVETTVTGKTGFSCASQIFGTDVCGTLVATTGAGSTAGKRTKSRG
jgi:hypothetical protein